MKASSYHALLAVALCGVLEYRTAFADDAVAHQHDDAQQSSEFVLFVSGEAHHFTEAASAGELNEDAPIIGDAVFALNHGPFRIFGEYGLSKEEHDLERFQLGYEVLPNTLVWIGRFHQPASAWNTEHHHGRYLQTAITRPAIELWEDEGGLIPQHITGLYIDSRHPLGDTGGLHLAAGVGMGVNIQEKGLEELDLLKPDTSGRRLSLSARLAYLPNFVETDEFGLLFAHNNMPVIDPHTASLLQATNVEETLFGVFANWSGRQWKVQSALYDLQFDLTQIGYGHIESFLAGYLQVERQLPLHLTAYAREENTDRAYHTRFVTVNHSDLDLRRASVGLRWDFTHNQALTVEVGKAQRADNRDDEYRLQWSAALQ